MRRREALLAFGSLCMAPVSLAARAQSRAVRIGYLAPRQRSVFLPSILKRLAQLGYVEGKNLALEYRSSDGDVDRFVPLAHELIKTKCDLIYAVGSEHPAQALAASKTHIPVIFIAVTYDPIKVGLVRSLSRPGGNITGMFAPLPELVVKHLELMQQTLPRGKRFLVLADTLTGVGDQLPNARTAARRLGLELVEEVFTTAPPFDLEAALNRAQSAKVEGVIVLDSASFFDQRHRLGQLLMQRKLPSVVNIHYFDEPNFLFAYGTNFHTAFARAGDMAARILSGAKPGDIPIEQATEFELAVNLKTARALGISVPGPLLARANRVIE